MKRLALTVLALAGLANADITYDNFGPNNSYSNAGFRVAGPATPITPWWTHAFPFVATTSGEISHVRIALTRSDGISNNYHVELRADAPGPGVLLANLGQVPAANFGSTALLNANAGGHVIAGQKYWIYIRGDGDSAAQWSHSPTLGGVRSFSHNGGFTFQMQTLTAIQGQGAMRIEVTPFPCYANCDDSTGSPRLSANDFQCFINKYASGDSYANCDGSSVTPVLTANDFQCYLDRYAAGCS